MSEALDYIGRVLNSRFELQSVLGRGGSGIVYQALDRQLDRIVAVKVLELKADSRSDPSYRERFSNEAALTARLLHPNIVTVFDHGETEDGVRYIAMELLKGRTLQDALANEPGFPWQRGVEIATQICRGLREAHSLGLVHRDLKPANVFLVEHDDVELVKVLDFGLAKPLVATPEAEITQAGVFLGSPTYMAPEQARNETSAQSDIYSLGVIVYRMLTGQLPFAARNSIDVIVQHLQSPVAPFMIVAPGNDIPAQLELVVRRCLEKNPRDRYPSMSAVLEAFKLALGLPHATGAFPRLRSSPEMTAVGPQRQTPMSSAVPAANFEAEIEIDVSESPPVAAAVPASPAQLSSNASRLPWILTAALALVMLVVAGSGLALILRDKAPPVVAAATPAPAPAPFDLTKPVRFRVNSIPAGASLKVDGRPMGITPASFEVPPDAEGIASASITLELEGYQSLSFTSGGNGPEVVMVQRLQKGRGRKALPPQINLTPSQVDRPERAERPVETDPTPVLVAKPTPVPVVVSPVAEQAPAEPAAPAPVEVTADAQSLSESMKRPEIISMGDPPRYTREAYAARSEGTAIAKCVIKVDGSVERCRMIKPVAHMTDALIASLKTRRYRPAELDGKPVEIEMAIAVKLLLLPPR